MLFSLLCYFFFNDTATTEIYTLSLHDALPICGNGAAFHAGQSGVFFIKADNLHFANLTGVFNCFQDCRAVVAPQANQSGNVRSEEHTSELQSRQYLVCRLLLEKKKSILLSTTY